VSRLIRPLGSELPQIRRPGERGVRHVRPEVTTYSAASRERTSGEQCFNHLYESGRGVHGTDQRRAAKRGPEN
jgi:hypothetical protein